MGAVQCYRTGHRASAVGGWRGGEEPESGGEPESPTIRSLQGASKARREILGTGDVSGRSRDAFLFADDQHWKMMPCKVSSGRCATNSDLTGRGLAGSSSAVEYRRPWSAAPPARWEPSEERSMPRVPRIIAPTNRTASTAIERFPACGRCPKRITDHADGSIEVRSYVLALPAALVVARRDLHRPTTPWANYILYLVHRPRFSRPSSIRCGAPKARASRLSATSSLVLSRTLGIAHKRTRPNS